MKLLWKVACISIGYRLLWDWEMKWKEKCRGFRGAWVWHYCVSSSVYVPIVTVGVMIMPCKVTLSIKRDGAWKVLCCCHLVSRPVHTCLEAVHVSPLLLSFSSFSEHITVAYAARIVTDDLGKLMSLENNLPSGPELLLILSYTSKMGSELSILGFGGKRSTLCKHQSQFNPSSLTSLVL